MTDETCTPARPNNPIPSPPHATLAVARPMAKEIAIRAEGVNYWYGEGEARTQVLFDNTLEIGRGEVVIMTGPSGSGKTTLLTLIGALRRMQQGPTDRPGPRRRPPSTSGARSSCGRRSGSSSRATTCSAP